MIRIIIITVISLFYQALQAQVQNYSFEDLNFVGQAKFWTSKQYLLSFHIDSSGTKTDSIIRDKGNYSISKDMAYNGKHALELRNDFNVTKNISQPGIVFASMDTTNDFFGSKAVLTSTRPVGVNFFAMYLPKEGDTAVVTLTVYNSNEEVIGSATLEIGKTYSKYTKFNIPVVYTSQDVAAYYSLSFASAKEGSRNSVGTVLYVDEVELLNATALDQAQESSFKIFPNPSAGSFKIETKQNVRVSQVQLVDLRGRTMDVKPTSDGVYWTDNLDDGIYIVMVRSNNFVGKYKLVVRR